MSLQYDSSGENMKLPQESSTQWNKTKSKSKSNVILPSSPDITPINYITSPLQTIPLSSDSVPPHNIIQSLFKDDKKSFETEDVEPFDINNPPDFSGLLDGNNNDVFDTATTYLNQFLDIIFYPITGFRSCLHTVAYNTGMILSKGTMTPSHEQCIYDFFSMLIAVAITIYMFYNWFFILYFHDDQVMKPLLDVSWTGLRDKSRFLSLLFKYEVCQVSLLNAVVLKIREYSKMINAQVFFIGLFLIMVTSCTTFGGHVIDLLQSAINQNVDSNFSNGLVAYAFVFAAYSMAKEAAEDSAAFIAKFTSFIMVIGTFVLFALRILVSISCIWIAALFIAVYIIIYSFLGIKLFSKYGIMETIHNINQFVVKGYEPPPPGKYDKCRPRTWVEFFVDNGKWIVNSITRHFFEFVIIYYLFESIYKFTDCMADNTGLRDSMIYITILMMFGVLAYIYSKIFPKVVSADQKVVHKVEHALGLDTSVSGGMEVTANNPPIPLLNEQSLESVKNQLQESPQLDPTLETPVNGQSHQPILETPVNGQSNTSVLETPVNGQSHQPILETPVNGQSHQPILETPVNGQSHQPILETPVNGQSNTPVREKPLATI